MRGAAYFFSKNEEDYLNIRGKVFSSLMKNKCKNILTIIKILLITPVTNAKLERMFKRMMRVKTGWRNTLVNVRLDHNLKVSEERVSITDINPSDDIGKWYNEKVTNLKGEEPQKYLEKQH